MHLDTSKVQFSKKDLKLGTKIPIELTSELAYFLGFHAGDGTLYFNRPKSTYVIGFTGHLSEENDLHQTVLIPLVRKLFNKEVHSIEDRRVNRSSIRTYFKSKAIFTFLHFTIGLPSGIKSNSDLPILIKNANKEIIFSFLRGLADADFTLAFKRRHSEYNYPVISFSTNNTRLTKSLNNLLLEIGFTTYSRFDFNKPRYDVPLISNYIQISGKKNLEIWMKLIGFSSPKHLTKYEIWKKFGNCPPHTTLIQRRIKLN